LLATVSKNRNIQMNIQLGRKRNPKYVLMPSLPLEFCFVCLITLEFCFAFHSLPNSKFEHSN
jgi:hypothetical protein